MGSLDVDLTEAETVVMCGYRDLAVLCYDGQSFTALLDLHSSDLHHQFLDSLPKISARRKIRLTLSYVPSFKVQRVEVNHTDSQLLLVGGRGLGLVKMPQDFWAWPTAADAYQDEYFCRCVLVEPRLFSMRPSLRCLKAKWHPGSETDGHIVTLYSDSVLRLYDTWETEGCQQVQKIDLNLSFDADHSIRTPIHSARFGLVASAVSFDFGPRVQREDSDAVYPIFVITGDGDVYCSTIDLNRSRLMEPVGPLRLRPQSEDNYGLDAVDLLCLCSAPVPVLCILTSAGLLCHAVLLQSPTELAASEMDYELFVYDCVELELSLSSIDLKSGTQMENVHSATQLALFKDESCGSRYLVVSEGGVHTVDLSDWTNDLANETTEEKEGEMTNRRSNVHFRLCTHVASHSHQMVTSATVFRQRRQSISWLLAALSSGVVFADSIDSCPTQTLPRQISDGRPLLHRNTEPETLEEVRRLLTPDSTIPSFRSNERLTEKQCGELFLRAVHTLRGRLAKQNDAKVFLDKRAVGLSRQRMEQRSQLVDLDRRCAEALNLCESVQTARRRLDVRFASVESRLQTLLYRMNRLRGPLSVEEQQVLTQLEHMQSSCNKMTSDSKQLSEQVVTHKKQTVNTIKTTTPRRLILEKSQDNIEKLVDTVKTLQNDLTWLEQTAEV